MLKISLEKRYVIATRENDEDFHNPDACVSIEESEEENEDHEDYGVFIVTIHNIDHYMCVPTMYALYLLLQENIHPFLLDDGTLCLK
jgi:hypothetical protein